MPPPPPGCRRGEGGRRRLGRQGSNRVCPGTRRLVFSRGPALRRLEKEDGQATIGMSRTHGGKGNGASCSCDNNGGRRVRGLAGARSRHRRGGSAFAAAPAGTHVRVQPTRKQPQQAGGGARKPPQRRLVVAEFEWLRCGSDPLLYHPRHYLQMPPSAFEAAGAGVRIRHAWSRGRATGVKTESREVRLRKVKTL